MTTLNLKSLSAQLLSSIYMWLENEGCRSMIHCNISNDCIVPPQFRNDENINLNITSVAINNLLINEDGIGFSARFGGREEQIYFPLKNVAAISCLEAGFYSTSPFGIMVTTTGSVQSTEEKKSVENIAEKEAPMPEVKKSPFAVIKGGKQDE